MVKVLRRFSEVIPAYRLKELRGKAMTQVHS
jgi:hypothetical protein